MSRAVITGCGVVSALGVGARTFWDALAEGRAAVGPIRHFDASGLPTRVAGEVPVLRTDGAWLREHLGGRMPEAALEAWEASGALRDRKIGFGWVAALEAWHQAGCGDDGSGYLAVDGARLGAGLPRGLRTAAAQGGRAHVHRLVRRIESATASGALPLADRSLCGGAREDVRADRARDCLMSRRVQRARSRWRTPRPSSSEARPRECCAEQVTPW